VTSVCAITPVHAQESKSIAAKNTLQHYIELRLRWADWKEYSPFITWPDEPGWDCWWVAKGYRIGQAQAMKDRTVIPTTYARMGLFYADFNFEARPKTETIRYELVYQGHAWKVDGPVPDYPYISERTLRQWLSKIVSSTNETNERKIQARRALKALANSKSD
jgi:hypothetical protein